MKKFENSVKQIIRVNHAGEYGAQKIYNGQIKFCKNRKLKKKLQRISNEEKVHFDYFNEQIIKQNSLPSNIPAIYMVFLSSLKK